MKINNIKNKFSNFVRIRNCEKEQRFLDKYVKIHDNTTYGDSYQQMCSSRKTIANYLRDKGVSIDIYDARKMMGEHDSPIVENRLSEALYIEAKNLLSNKKASKFVSAKTDESRIHKVPDYIVIDYPAEGIQQTRLTSHEYEDNFVRHLYRSIEDLVKKVQG